FGNDEIVLREVRRLTPIRIHYGNVEQHFIGAEPDGIVLTGRLGIRRWKSPPTLPQSYPRDDDRDQRPHNRLANSDSYALHNRIILMLVYASEALSRNRRRTPYNR